MITGLDVGNVCAGGVNAPVTYAWGTDFIPDEETAEEIFDFLSNEEDFEFAENGFYLDEKAGVFRIASGDGFLSIVSGRSKKEFVLPEEGKRYFFKARARLSDVTNSSMVLGLAVRSDEPNNLITDGIYFKKDSGDALLDLAIKSGSVDATTNAELTALHTMSNSTFVNMAFEVLVTASGKCHLDVWADGRHVVQNKTVTANAPATEMGIVFAVQAGEGSYKFLDLDYVSTGAER